MAGVAPRHRQVTPLAGARPAGATARSDREDWTRCMTASTRPSCGLAAEIEFPPTPDLRRSVVERAWAGAGAVDCGRSAWPRAARAGRDRHAAGGGNRRRRSSSSCPACGSRPSRRSRRAGAGRSACLPAGARRPRSRPTRSSAGVPAALGSPTRRTSSGDHEVLSLVYLADDDLPDLAGSGIGLLVQDIDGALDRERVEKLVAEGATVTPVEVDGDARLLDRRPAAPGPLHRPRRRVSDHSARGWSATRSSGSATACSIESSPASASTRRCASPSRSAVGGTAAAERCIGLHRTQITSSEEVLDMRYLTRVGAGLATLAALLALITGTALAGGWAEVVMTGGSEDPADRRRDRRDRVHAPPARGHGRRLRRRASSRPSTRRRARSITVPATSLGGGRWSASVTFPAAGSWQIGVSAQRARDVRADDADGRAGRPARVAARRC